MPEFLDQHPGVTLDLRLSDSLFDLIEGSFDLAIRNATMEATSLKGRKPADDTRILCAAPSYIEKYGEAQTPEDLASHQLVAFKEATPLPLSSRDGRVGLFDRHGSRCSLIVDDGLS